MAHASFLSCILIWKSIFGAQISPSYRNAGGRSDVSAAAMSWAGRTWNTQSAHRQSRRFSGCRREERREKHPRGTKPTAQGVLVQMLGFSMGQGPPRTQREHRCASPQRRDPRASRASQRNPLNLNLLHKRKINSLDTKKKKPNTKCLNINLC